MTIFTGALFGAIFLVGIVMWLIGWRFCFVKAHTGIFIDSRGRYSLNHFQLVFWSLLILSTLIAGFLASGLDVSSLAIPIEVVGLLGISYGSGALSGAVKSAKDHNNRVKVGRINEVFDELDADGKPVLKGAVTDTRTITPHWSQWFLVEEGEFSDKVIDITKFQNFIFTIVLTVAFLTLVVKAQGFPADLPQEVLWLIGVSQSGYVGGKIPDRK